MKAITKVFMELSNEKEEEWYDFVRRALLRDEVLRVELGAAGVHEENMADFILIQYYKSRKEEATPPLRLE